MRTYSHLIFTLKTAKKHPGWAAPGAALPDLPALVGAALSGVRSRDGFYSEVCSRRRFSVPDAALHSAPVAALALTGLWRHGRGRSFALGWLSHVALDALTHREDARPLLWPLSGWRPGSPVSYRDRTFTFLEHAALLFTCASLVGEGTRR